MKKTASVGIVVFILSASMLGMITITEPVSAVNGSFGGGNGTASNPYLIEDVYDLQNMSSNLSAYYALANDINATITRTWNGGAGFMPVGNLTAPFKGGFDGRGYNITGLYINRPNDEYVGLFGDVAYGSTVHDFNLKNASITGGNYTGAVAGHTSEANITQLINVPTAPEAYWKMNEPFWNGTTGEVKDSSGNGNDGTALNGTNTTIGKYNRSGNFDGVDDYIETGKTATDLGINGSAPRTIMFWVYTRSFNNGGVYECGAYLTDQDFSFRTLTTNDTWRVQLITYDIDFTYPSLDKWVHFAIVYDGTNVIVYADGTEITSGARALNTADTNTFKIGEWNGAYFDGLIDEMVLYDRALSSSEIAQAYYYQSIQGIYNIHVSGAVSGANYTGGLVGLMDIGMDASYSSFSGSVQGIEDVGGIAGANLADISNCYASGNVSGTNGIGGLVGEAQNSTIENSYAHANVTGTAMVGGLIGVQLNGLTTGTHASGTVHGALYAGGLVGEANGGNVSNSYADTQVSGNNDTGGMIGYLLSGVAYELNYYGNVSGGDNTGGIAGAIEYSTLGNSTVDKYMVQGRNGTGGLVGYASHSNISTSKCWASIIGSSMVGGVAGSILQSQISESVATAGSINGENYTAGLVGYAEGSSISRSYSGSSVQGNIWVGGLAGYAASTYFTDTYSMSEIDGNSVVGGLVGESNLSAIERAYRSRSFNASGLKGAIVAVNNGSLNSVFVDNQTITGMPYVGTGNTSGVLSLNTTALLNSSTYTAWNLTGVWWMFSGMTRPFLCSEFSTQIYDDHELQLLRISAVSFTVHRDIYISGDKNWSMWGNVGSFLMIPIAYDVDGGEHYIHNLRMTGQEGDYDWYYAFIAEEYGYVANIHLVNASIHISFLVKALGGLIGYKTSGTIFGSSFEGNITYDLYVSGSGDSRTGGLIGFAYCGDTNTINIYNSMFRGTINGQGYVGGLVGQYIASYVSTTNYLSYITNSYVIGDINNRAPLSLVPATAGLIGSFATPGYGRLVIQNSYFAGTVEAYAGLTGPISAYYPDRPTAPAVVDTYYHSASTFDIFEGYPLTEDEMLHAASFHNWDFTGPWRIQENHTYPYLAWERNYPVRITSPNSLPNATQGENYSVKFNSTDGNPTDVRPLWTLKTNADWLHISQNGTLYGTPGPYDVGTWWVNITVRDMRGSSDWRNMTVSVDNVNDAPVITTTDVKTATQDELYSVTYNATDADGDTLIWSLNTNATWLTLSGSTLTGTPSNADVGIYWVNISVSDGHGGIAWHNFTLTVKNVNDPPNITTDDVTTATQGVIYSVEYNATDPDGDALIWTLSTNASWLNLDGSHLWGIPDNADVGTYWVNISVSDGNGGIDWHNFTLTVLNVNDPPVITTKDMDTATQGVLYSVTYNATDPDGDSLTWTLNTNALWLSLTGSTISGTPTNVDVGAYWVNISVSDGHGGIAWHNFTLTVKNVNDPPVINTTDVTNATQNVLYLVTYSATDPDGDSLTWSLQTNATWLTLAGSTLYGTPSDVDVGTYWVNISVSDGNGGVDWHNFTLTVKNINDPPTITTKDVDTATQDVLYSVTYNATDPDGDSLTWTLNTNALWLTLNGSTIFGTPANADVGTYWVNITVSDGNGGIAWHNFTLTVLNVNDPPTITTSDITSAIQGVLYIVEYNATDPDGDSLTWTLKTNASWITLAGSTIYGVPSNADVGIFWVNISVSDGHGGIAWHNFTLIVQNVNDPPTITTKDVDTATQDVLYSVTYNATDPDGDSLTWHLKTDAAWLTLAGSTLYGTPTNADVGTYWVNVSVSDGHGGIDWHNFTLTVINVNDPPVISNFTVPDGALEMEYALLLTASDPDGDALTWSINGPTWLSINNGLITGIPAQAGNFTVNVTVSDPYGNKASVTFIIHITADSDGDGVNNNKDAYPLDPTRWNPPVVYQNKTVYVTSQSDNIPPIILALVSGIVIGLIIMSIFRKKFKPENSLNSNNTNDEKDAVHETAEKHTDTDTDEKPQ